MSSFNINDITVLCSVVDNYGDIGFSYRLIRHLLANYPFLKIRIITDNLEYFSILNPLVNPSLNHQVCGELEIFNWKDYELCYKSFTDNPPSIILECFQCGQPDWMEKILFEDRVNHPVQIIMIDYLSAESWVEDFHGLKSLTRTALVPKVNFMPGFTSKTGGLLFNTESKCYQKLESQTPLPNHNKMLFFAYAGNWNPVVKALNRFLPDSTEVLVAGGAGQKDILKACKENQSSFDYKELPYLSQDQWDKMMTENFFMIIRGEDSMAQACQAGIPFLWQAYPQKDDYQLVKVKALLERMKQHFGQEFQFVENAWISLNGGNGNLEDDTFSFLQNLDKLKPGFESFSKSLYSNGDLANNLMTFISQYVKIE